MLLAQLFVEFVPIAEHAPDERPEPIVLLQIRQPLAAEDDQPIGLPAPGFQKDIEALDIPQPVCLVEADARAIQQKDIAAVEQGIITRLRPRLAAATMLST